MKVLYKARGVGGAALNEVGLRPEVQPLTFYIPFLAEKVSLSYT